MDHQSSLQQVISGAFGTPNQSPEAHSPAPDTPPQVRPLEFPLAVAIALVLGLGAGTVFGWLTGSYVTESSLSRAYERNTAVLQNRLKGDLAERDRYYHGALRENAEALRRETDAIRRFANDRYQHGFMVGWHYVFKDADVTQFGELLEGIDQRALAMEHVPAPPDPAVVREGEKRR